MSDSQKRIPNNEESRETDKNPIEVPGLEVTISQLVSGQYYLIIRTLFFVCIFLVGYIGFLHYQLHKLRGEIPIPKVIAVTDDYRVKELLAEGNIFRSRSAMDNLAKEYVAEIFTFNFRSLVDGTYERVLSERLNSATRDGFAKYVNEQFAKSVIDNASMVTAEVVGHPKLEDIKDFNGIRIHTYRVNFNLHEDSTKLNRQLPPRRMSVRIDMAEGDLYKSSNGVIISKLTLGAAR